MARRREAGARVAREDIVKRSLQAVLALLVTVAGLALVAPAAPAGAAPAKPKAFVATVAPTTSVLSQAVRLTAAITPKGGGRPKGGTVTFLADGVPVGTATATTRNTTITTSTLPPGTHVISAQHSGDAVTAPSTSTTTATTTVVAAETTIALRATEDPVPYDERAEIKATVTPLVPASVSRRPTGSVTFSVDGCAAATVPVNSNGVATWRPWLCSGTRSITATYEGSERHAASTSASPLVIEVEDPVGPDDEDLDQVNEGDPGDLVTISNDGEISSSYAQTFRAGRTGLLYAVDLAAAWTSETDTAPGPLEVTIQTVGEDGEPTGDVQGYGQLVAPEEQGDPIHHIDLDVAAGVAEGQTYAIVLETGPQTPEAFGIWLAFLSTDDAYVPGEVLELQDGGAWFPHPVPGVDVMFRTHVSDPV